MPSSGSKSQPVPRIKSTFKPAQLHLKYLHWYRNETLYREGTLTVADKKSDDTFILLLGDLSLDLNPPKGQISRPVKWEVPLDQATVDTIRAVPIVDPAKIRCDFAIFEGSPGMEQSFQETNQSRTRKAG